MTITLKTQVRSSIRRRMMCQLLANLSRIFLLLLLFILACQSAENSQKQPERYTVIVLEESTYYRGENESPATLKSYQIECLEIIIKYAIIDYNNKLKGVFQRMAAFYSDYNYKDNESSYIQNFDKYYRQYMPIINSKGELVVNVNCFCHLNKDDWRTELYQVDDGGNCYFQVEVNLTKKTFAKVNVNGLG